MTPTHTMRRQHAAMLQLGNELDTCLKNDSQDAAKAATILAKLAGTLTVHLAAEDRSLYPRLIASTDAATTRTAQSFMGEMGFLAEAFKAYAGQWTFSRIKADWAGFRSDSTKMLAALRTRMEREERDLYPLADRLHTVRTAAA